MTKDSESTSKLMKWSTLILAIATFALFVTTAVYASITWFTGRDIKMAFEYYSSQRIMGLLWDDYKYDRDTILPTAKSDIFPTLKKDLGTIYLELRNGEDQLRYYKCLPDENYKRIQDALCGFANDYSNAAE
jgi:hypothetical protein